MGDLIINNHLYFAFYYPTTVVTLSAVPVVYYPTTVGYAVRSTISFSPIFNGNHKPCKRTAPKKSNIFWAFLNIICTIIQTLIVYKSHKKKHWNTEVKKSTFRFFTNGMKNRNVIYTNYTVIYFLFMFYINGKCKT